MSSRKRITIALVGMILLVIIGWFAREAGDGAPARPRGTVTSSAAVQQSTPSSFIIDVDG
ncbi:hypothetical protein [Haloactinomyces albus]|uniref:Uncharacterized protein n=1 Tax=Haloactinomyces albus TaxID=1352928 RepID=A0AAE3ZCC3_9ACTN|nr:hypothetical protein [Haloactinomyces albus]MDR7300934.1 hypothetical protein [Haloactinomyces albus]